MDVTEAVTQDQIADTLVAEPEEQAVDTASTEEIAQLGEEQLDTQQQEGVDEDADWLPEQQRTFSDQDLLKYAQRYQKDEQWLSDPLNRQLLIDKINTDIFVRQQQQQPEFEPEPEAEPEPQRPTQQPVPIQQWMQNASTFAKQNGLINPDVANMFAKSFMGAFGITEKDIPQGFNAEAFTEPFVVFGMNLINSLMPLYFNAPSPTDGKNMLQHFLESQYDGLGDLAQKSAYSSAWENVAKSSPELAKLKYGSDEFSQMMERAEQTLPGLQWMQFADNNGKPLSQKANAERQYQIAVRIAKGQQVNPELMKQAVQTGQRLARQSQVRKQAGNLGAGNSKQQFSQQSDDDFWNNPASWNNYVDRRL